MAGFRSRKRTGGKITKTAAKSYRRHRKSSHCHKKKLYACVSAPGCTIVKKSSRAKAYCRKMKNTRRRGRRGGGAHDVASAHHSRKNDKGKKRSPYHSRHTGMGGRRTRKGGLSPLSPASVGSSGAKAADVSGHFGAIVPGGPGHQGPLPTAAHELSQASMNALQVGESPSGASALMDPLRPKPFGGQLLPFAFGVGQKGGAKKSKKGKKGKKHGRK